VAREGFTEGYFFLQIHGRGEGSVKSSHSWVLGSLVFFWMSQVNHLFNRLFHLKFFQTFYYSKGQGELFEGVF